MTGCDIFHFYFLVSKFLASRRSLKTQKEKWKRTIPALPKLWRCVQPEGNACVFGMLNLLFSRLVFFASPLILLLIFFFFLFLWEWSSVAFFFSPGTEYREFLYIALLHLLSLLYQAFLCYISVDLFNSLWLCTLQSVLHQDTQPFLIQCIWFSSVCVIVIRAHFCFWSFRTPVISDDWKCTAFPISEWQRHKKYGSWNYFVVETVTCPSSKSAFHSRSFRL